MGWGKDGLPTLECWLGEGPEDAPGMPSPKPGAPLWGMAPCWGAGESSQGSLTSGAARLPLPLGLSPMVQELSKAGTLARSWQEISERVY